MTESSSNNKDDNEIDIKIPPNSVEAEQSILGGLMLDNSAWDKIADIIVKSDFYRKDHQIIFDCLLYTSPSPRDVEESRMPSSA